MSVEILHSTPSPRIWNANASRPNKYRVNTKMAYLYDGIMDTLEGSVSQIEINKRMASGNNIMDQYADFFLKNEKDMDGR